MCLVQTEHISRADGFVQARMLALTAVGEVLDATEAGKRLPPGLLAQVAHVAQVRSMVCRVIIGSK